MLSLLRKKATKGPRQRDHVCFGNVASSIALNTYFDQYYSDGYSVRISFWLLQAITFTHYQTPPKRRQLLLLPLAVHPTHTLPLTIMRTRTLLASVTALCITASVIASALAADAPVLRSCARLSGAEKATCEWENHKVYKDMANQPAMTNDGTEQSNAPAVVLASCARLSGKDKALCEWNNVKKMRSLQRNPHLPDTASASSQASIDDTGGSAFIKTCGRAAGKERARCVLKLRQHAREKRSGSSSSAS